MADRVRFAYFVHDVTDAAVARRIRMMEAGGATVHLLGFRRRGDSVTRLGNATVTDLGRTGDAKLIRRIGSVLAVLLRPAKVRAALGPRHVLVARNLETLVIARMLGGERRIVFECLDIHRLLSGTGPPSRALRAIERWALRGVALIVVSSPRFATEHFARYYAVLPPVLLAENRLLALEELPPRSAPSARDTAAPWVIGWFGMLRCARTLAMLKDIVAQGEGRIRVLIAGIASPAVFTDFAAEVAAVPEFEFTGAYRSDQLADLYARVDVAWSIDYFEAGLNSAWLLPNRLYESLAHGAIPVALSGTETAAWLIRNHVGLVVDDPQRDLPGILDALTSDAFAALKRSVSALPPTLTRAGPEDCRELVADLAGC